jgi:hypothetical protein
MSKRAQPALELISHLPRKIMKWITREKIKVDRMACPWLIRKFIDAKAKFVFLPPDTDWSKIDNGMVFDVPNCELGHHGEERFV